MNLKSIKQLVSEVIEGEESALKAYGIIKEQIKELELCLESVKDQALEESNTYEKSFKKEGFVFERRAGRRIFDFKGIPEWSAKKAELKAIEVRAKSAFSAYENNLNTSDEEGEIPILPIVNYSKDSLIVKSF